MVAVLSMAAAAAISTDMVPPSVTQNKHRSRYRRRLAFGDGCERALLGSLLHLNTNTETVKLKNPNAPAVVREAEEDWGK